jgi:hypothetical protein
MVFAVHFWVLFLEEKACLCEDHVCLSPRISVHLKISCITHHDISLEKTEGVLYAWLEDAPKRQKEPCVYVWMMRHINVCQSVSCGDRGHVVIQTLHWAWEF